MEPEILGLIDDAHAAGADPRSQPVMPDDGPRRWQGHGFRYYQTGRIVDRRMGEKRAARSTTVGFQQAHHLGAKLRIAGARLLKGGVALRLGHVTKAAEEISGAPVLVLSHDGSIRGWRRSKSHARATRQSRTTVGSEMPRTAATSTLSRPPK